MDASTTTIERDRLGSSATAADMAHFAAHLAEFLDADRRSLKYQIRGDSDVMALTVVGIDDSDIHAIVSAALDTSWWIR